MNFSISHNLSIILSKRLEIQIHLFILCKHCNQNYMTLAGVVPIPSQVYMTQDCLHKYTYIYLYIYVPKETLKRVKREEKKKEVGKIIIF